ncbi:hypothetical protein ACFE04_024945 [Oxalis oulophora]
MERLLFSAISLFLFMCLPNFSSSTTFISDEIFGSQTSTGRVLLQAKKSCSVNFEFQNYTIVTSTCKGPSYPADKCCAAFKEFACPFVDDINDLTTDCSSTMFSYINLYGKYPPGLFSSECKEGKEGLACSDTSSSDSSSGHSFNYSPSLLLTAMASVVFLVFQLQ